MTAFRAFVPVLLLVAPATSPAIAQDDVFRRGVVVREDSSRRVLRSADIAYEAATPGAVMDIYRPTQKGPHPAVIFVHGGPLPALPGSIKNMGLFQSYGRLMASRGVAAVTFAYPFGRLADLERATEHVDKAITFVRDRAVQYDIDPDRLCLWIVSGGGIVVAPLLKSARTYLRCLLFYYAVVDPSAAEEVWPVGIDTAQHSVVSVVARRGSEFPPILIARAGADVPSINRTLDSLLAVALRSQVAVDFLALPKERHGFDVLDDTPRSREVIEHSLGFVRRHLLGTIAPN